MLRTTRDEATPLLGRLEEQGLLVSVLEDVTSRGRGRAAWPGRHRQVAAAGRERASGPGARDVGAHHDRVQAEAHLPFAGLHQLLRPVRERASRLREVQRAALDAAFGLTDGGPPEQFRIAMSVLDLLSDVATATPLLVLVEDAQWLDRATADVLAFVARRIESDQIVLLAAIRDGYWSPLGGAGF
jgi:hypothetical protein